jgi:SAM-dependent methyltransferase
MRNDCQVERLSHSCVSARLVLQGLLRSKLVWGLSGFSYRTAVVATKGSYAPLEEYLEICRLDTSAALTGAHITGSRVLEFGCGLGGNLISISPAIGEGVGLDVNKGYIRIARRISKMTRCSNLNFLVYDGWNMPELGKFDLVYCFNVFERIPKSTVRSYLMWMRKSLGAGGKVVFFFLSTRAQGTPFTHRLGNSAYVFGNSPRSKHPSGLPGIPTFELSRGMGPMPILRREAQREAHAIAISVSCSKRPSFRNHPSPGLGGRKAC